MGLLRLFKNPKKDVERLIIALGDKDKSVSCNAAIALGRIGDPRAVEPLIAALGDIDIQYIFVRESAARALGEIGDPRAVPSLEKAANDSSSWKGSIHRLPKRVNT